MADYQLFIDGELCDAASGETFATHDPATGEKIADVAKAGRDDAVRAIEAARKAFDEGPWPKMSGKERAAKVNRIAELIGEHAEELAELEVRDSGGTIRKASLADIPGGKGAFEWFAKMAETQPDEVALEASLACDEKFKTWTDVPGDNEARPINCITWWEALAFCIWDGGFLPSAAEWNYAAAGGSDLAAAVEEEDGAGRSARPADHRRVLPCGGDAVDAASVRGSDPEFAVGFEGDLRAVGRECRVMVVGGVIRKPQRLTAAHRLKVQVQIAPSAALAQHIGHGVTRQWLASVQFRHVLPSHFHFLRGRLLDGLLAR